MVVYGDYIFIEKIGGISGTGTQGREMEQKHILLSALSVGVGVGVGLSKWAGYNSSSSAEGVTAEQIEAEISRLVVDGKESKVTFDDFPYYLR